MAPPPPPEIQNPRRILAVALAESQELLARVIRDLTGSTLEASSGTGALAGTTQELALRTAYYQAQVPVWLDLVGSGGGDSDKEDEKEAEAGGEKPQAEPTTPRQWADAFLAAEAREVREALGGVVAVVAMDGATSKDAAYAKDIQDAKDTKATKDVADIGRRQRSLVAHVGRLVREGLGTAYDDEKAEGDKGRDDDEDDEITREAWDGVGLVVGVSAVPVPAEGGGYDGYEDDAVTAWEDACAAAGLEFVLVAPGQAAMNEFGEKTGIERVLEALQANDWSYAGGGMDDGLADDLEKALFGDFQGAGSDDDGDGDGGADGGMDDPAGLLGFGYDRTDFAGLRQAIWQQQAQEVEGEEDDADAGSEGTSTKDKAETSDGDHAVALERAVRKLQLARELGESMTPAQRRAMAARVVGEVMEEI